MGDKTYYFYKVKCAKEKVIEKEIEKAKN